MADTFFHGIELVEIDTGISTIQTVRSSVVGLIGTAPDLDALTKPANFPTDADWEAAKAKFPLNVPVLLTGPRQITGIGATGTLPAALKGIYAQAAPWIIIIRVAEGATTAETETNVIGEINTTTGVRSGSFAFVDSRDLLQVTPRILIAPGFTSTKAVADALLTQADRLKAVVIADGPNTTDTAAVAYRTQFGSPRLYLVDPWVRIPTVNGEALEPASARVAGIIAGSDIERGFWWSPSNRVMLGINGGARPIAWAFNDPEVQANYLNENSVATIIHQDGYRLWGNRSTSIDPRWVFLSVRRTADLINESLIQAHLWAVDRNITKTYIEDVTGSVNAYLRTLKALGAIIGGRCYADPELNTPENIAAGRVYFDFDFTPPYPAERITFQSHMVNDYLVEILP